MSPIRDCVMWMDTMLMYFFFAALLDKGKRIQALGTISPMGVLTSKKKIKVIKKKEKKKVLTSKRGRHGVLTSKWGCCRGAACQLTSKKKKSPRLKVTAFLAHFIIVFRVHQNSDSAWDITFRGVWSLENKCLTKLYHIQWVEAILLEWQ